MRNLKSFSVKITDINTRSSGELIKYFAYYLQCIEEVGSFTGSHITQCFTELLIKPYSNISAYLSLKTTSKPPMFLKTKDGYKLTKHSIEQINAELSIPIEIPTTDELLDLTILESAPYYLKSIAKQMAQCYECNLYDATLVLMRKLVETLIIECFERFGIEDNIKDNNGNFLFLSDLIPRYLASNKWNSSMNIGKSIKEVKKYGDLSAHNRRFQAKKSDIVSFKFELRQTIQEIILTIDYSTWIR